jgi:hypothetical protein
MNNLLRIDVAAIKLGISQGILRCFVRKYKIASIKIGRRILIEDPGLRHLLKCVRQTPDPGKRTSIGHIGHLPTSTAPFDCSLEELERQAHQSGAIKLKPLSEVGEETRLLEEKPRKIWDRHTFARPAQT